MRQLVASRGKACQECGRSDVRLFGDHVHEIKDGGALLDPTNIRLLCGSCHTKKTAKTRAARMAQRHGR
jgi:5-methylcytosine-specific restriction endonuclease McrA